MKKKLLSMLLCLGVIGVMAQNRPGSLKGEVLETATGYPIPGANIAIKSLEGKTITGGSTDGGGQFNIKPIEPGTYNVEISFIGFRTIVAEKVVINPNKASRLDFKMDEDDGTILDPIIIEGEPLIKKNDDMPRISGKEFREMPIRNPTEGAILTKGVTPTPNGVSINGARPDGTKYIHDGVPLSRPINLPKEAIGSISVISSGQSAMYGDAVGGLISTTSRGITNDFFGSAELLSSSLFDNYGYNLASFTMGGPLFKRKIGKDTVPIVGFLWSTEYERSQEQSPSWVPYIGINRNYLNNLETNPLLVNTSGQSIFYRSEFTTEDQLEDEDARRNSYSNQIRSIANLKFRTGRTSNLTLGGRLTYTDRKLANRFNHIFNYNTNLDSRSADWTARAQYQQYFRSDSSSRIKNVYYTIQADYTRFSGETKDARYGTNFFRYGHVGEFDVLTTPSYAYGVDSVTGLSGYLFNGDSPSGVHFRQGPFNTVRGNYARHYFELQEQFSGLGSNTIEELIGNGIPVNGTGPRAVYGLWGSPGGVQGRYSKFRNSQFRLSGSASFDINDHSFIAGFEFEQRSNRAYSLDATGLWTQMRLLQNRPNQDLDLANPIVVRDANGVYQDTIRYNYLYSPNDASTFAQNVRAANGMDPFSTEQINIMNMDPDLFDLSFFSADELINPGGANYVNYFGYDYTGNVLNYQPSISEFFTARDDNGNLSRPVGAFQPIYVAGYIQDQFDFRDLSFNVGVRVDRFDLNQEVLVDPYVLFPTYRVKDIPNTELSSGASSEIPSNIGGDYVVYVSSFDYGEASIVGYRDPQSNQWFDANGDPLADPQDLSDAAGGGIKPMLRTPPGQTAGATSTLTQESFTDYEPQVVVMPRISFNFPINDEALFVAHYDVLAQRPNTGVSRLNPFSYLNLLNKDGGGILNNPNLKPQVTTEYELGFKQLLTQNSSLKISALYRELRDMLQTRAFTQAYPITYVAYDNLDFSTTKGFTVEYELRRTNNVSIRSNYTLLFADGTGSDLNSGAALANSGQPNLRYILPLNFDRRHQLMFNMDFRYAGGDYYNGPKWYNKNVFENAGINLTMNALSGTPYTKRVDFRSNAQIDGQINGARLPWQVSFDARINKMFVLGKNKTLDVYLQIFNLLNTQNVTGVYAFTGSPDDDGFLSSATAAAQVSQQASAQSYVDMYNRSINNPGNFSLPRRIRLGVTYNF